MPKCSDCRKKDIELLTRRERFKNWAFNRLFTQDIIDLSQNKYTQGFGDGYKEGRKTERRNTLRTLDALRYPPDVRESEAFKKIREEDEKTFG